jgi:DNA-binding transcriptional LysR family regulator
MQIKRLEEILGVPVFERNATSIKLNAEGEIFIVYARRILSLFDESISKITGKKLITNIRLGCIEDYAARVLPPILAEFWEKYPDVHIEVSTGETSELLARLGSDYDVILAMHPAGSGEGRLIYREALVWVSSSSRSPHEADPVPVALRPEGCAEREWAIVSLEAIGRAWRCAYVSAAIGTLQTAVEQGLAVGVFKESTITGDLRRLGAADGFPALPDVEIALHVASDDAFLPVVNLLVETLATGIRELDMRSSSNLVATERT